MAWSGTDVDVTSLEGRIADLWRQAIEGTPKSHPVRTHIFNLVIYTRSRAEAEAIIADLRAIQRYHPSRTIVLIADRLHDETRVDAELTVECQDDRDGTPKYCHERVVLDVCGRAADHLSSVVAPILLPELPTYLWWPGQPLFGHRVFHRLLGTAQQLLVDSAQFDSPGDGMADLANLCGARLAVNDFNWARLTPWREIIAQFFDGPGLAPYLYGIRSIRLEFGTGRSDEYQATASVLLLMGWVAAQLGWEPETTLDRAVDRDVTLAVLQGNRLIPTELRFRGHGRAAAGRLIDLEIDASAPDRPDAIFRVRRGDDLQQVRIQIAVGGEQTIERVVPLLTRSDAELVADELSVTARDEQYRAVVQAASRLAGREVWRPM